MLTSAMLIGAGMAAYKYAQKNNLMSGRQMKRMQKRITKAIF
ncbi:YrzQ family protein [Cytobacillus sp. NCCP-133]|nr:YrzQ family protein [Cytobacillus sp. NCCP-133]